MHGHGTCLHPEYELLLLLRPVQFDHGHVQRERDSELDFNINEADLHQASGGDGCPSNLRSIDECQSDRHMDFSFGDTSVIAIVHDILQLRLGT